jgi:osmoprotectant transport system substrate-binding protein
MKGLRSVVSLLLMLVLAAGLGACGSSGDAETVTGKISRRGHQAIAYEAKNRKVALTVGYGRSTEQAVLGQIYAQALAAAGYTVHSRGGLGSPTVALRELRAGRISAFPVPMSTALNSFFGVRLVDVHGIPRSVYRKTKAHLATLGLTAFRPTPFISAYVVAALGSTAEKHHWLNLFDMEGWTERLDLYAPAACRQRRDCLAGLVRNYSEKFKSFTPAGRAAAYRALESRRADAAFVVSTDGELAVEGGRKFSMVRDDKRILPAGNVVLVASAKVARDGGPDLYKTISAVQKDLTLPVIQELDARAQARRGSAEEAAAYYLRTGGYITDSAQK